MACCLRYQVPLTEFPLQGYHISPTVKNITITIIPYRIYPYIQTLLFNSLLFLFLREKFLLYQSFTEPSKLALPHYFPVHLPDTVLLHFLKAQPLCPAHPESSDSHFQNEGALLPWHPLLHLSRSQEVPESQDLELKHKAADTQPLIPAQADYEE